LKETAKETVAERKGRIFNDAAFSLSIPGEMVEAATSAVRKLNPNLIDRSGTPLHLQRHDPTSAGEAQ